MRFSREYTEVPAAAGELLATGEPILDLPRTPSARLDAMASEAFDALYIDGKVTDDATGPHWTTPEFAKHALRSLPPRVLGQLLSPLAGYTAAIDHTFIAFVAREYVITVSEHRDDERRHSTYTDLAAAIAVLPGIEAVVRSGLLRWGPIGPHDYSDLAERALDHVRRVAPHLMPRGQHEDFGRLDRAGIARFRAVAFASEVHYQIHTGQPPFMHGDPEVAFVRRNLHRLDEIAAVAAERRTLDTAILRPILDGAAPALRDGAL